MCKDCCEVIGLGFELVDVGKCDVYFDLQKKEKLTMEEEYEIKEIFNRMASLLIKKINLDNEAIE